MGRQIKAFYKYEPLNPLMFDVPFFEYSIFPFPHEPISWVSWLWNKNYLGGKKGANCETHLKHF